MKSHKKEKNEKPLKKKEWKAMDDRLGTQLKS